MTPDTEDLQENHREVVPSVASGWVLQKAQLGWVSSKWHRALLVLGQVGQTAGGAPVRSSTPILAASDCWDPAWAGPSLDAIGLSETGEAAKSHLKLAGWVGPETCQALEGEWAAGWFPGVGTVGEDSTEKEARSQQAPALLSVFI